MNLICSSLVLNDVGHLKTHLQLSSQLGLCEPEEVTQHLRTAEGDDRQCDSVPCTLHTHVYGRVTKLLCLALK